LRRFFPQNEKKEGTRKDAGPQITQMDADEDLFFSVSASICVNLRAIPDSVAAMLRCASLAKFFFLCFLCLLLFNFFGYGLPRWDFCASWRLFGLL
jgi:hypothetical protein